MSSTLANVWARRIHAGAHTLEEVEERYGASGVAAVKQAYFNLYGVEL